MKLKYKIIIIISCVFIFLYFFIILWYNGLIWPNTPSKKKYPVRGVDVSSYQGEIDWETLENQDIDFAFIKATEGSGSRTSIFSRIFKMRLKQALESVHTIFSALTVQELHRLKILSKPCQKHKICCRL